MTHTTTEYQRERETPFRLIVEGSGDILTIREADGRIRYTNPSFYRHLGYREEEIVGSTCFELIHPEDRSDVMAALEKLKNTPGGRGAVRCRARHADGSWGTYEIVAHNMLDHPVLCGLVINGREVEGRPRDASKNSPSEELESPDSAKEILCICASCKKIRDDQGRWRQVESYIRECLPVEFSHGMCMECAGLWSREGDHD